MSFNENTRVKIPAILHLCKLGYQYLSLKESKNKNITYNPTNNIFESIFLESLERLNPEIDTRDLKSHAQKVALTLNNEDLGKEFYQYLLNTNIRLIDFDNFRNNTLHVVTELTYKNGEDEFRPDITLLINGLPLALIEVKKPNNKDGILAERQRIDERFQNKKFRSFINLTQLLVFSNNMEYDDTQLQGSFYATTSYSRSIFNAFKEEDEVFLQTLHHNFSKISATQIEHNERNENFVLQDNNLQTIKHSPEFLENKSPNTSTNRILTSIFSTERFPLFLKYGLAYLKNEQGQIQKHVMRYPQFFATKAIEKTLNNDIKKGIIWHTQGSGKTALTFYNVRYLKDFYQKKNIIPKFYFIVDRIDLLKQATREFTERGLRVHHIDSKEQFIQDFQSNQLIHNKDGDLEITVVNIQKFQDDLIKLENTYQINRQRFYFLDEVHRSYNPTGSFLANLIASDRDAVMIGLTGTPLIGDNFKSKDIFGDYIHKYYYNQSIADGYTLRLIREGVETDCIIQMQEALKSIEVKKGILKEQDIQADARFVQPMLAYIIKDLVDSRVRLGDKTIGAMMVCHSSVQAKELYEQFQQNSNYHNLKASLILHDIGDKQSRNDEIDAFKAGKSDILFVFNMLLTGFDAPRLKKLYLARGIKKHNLLQTLTRVNRTYKNFRFGYVVDFADIQAEFDATNRAYFEELQSELGDELQTYSKLFLSPEEIEEKILEIKETLFHFDLKNSEKFSQQINVIQDKKEILQLKKTLQTSRDIFNLIKYSGNEELLDALDFTKLKELHQETSNRLDLLNFQESIEQGQENANFLNIALETMQNVLFKFIKVSEEEMKIADELKGTLQQAREALNYNFDRKDPEYITLYDEFKRLFGAKNLSETEQNMMSDHIISIRYIYDKITDLNRRDNLLKEKYDGDEKFVRIHKKFLPDFNKLNARETKVFEALMNIKYDADEKVMNNDDILNNESYFNRLMTPTVKTHFSNTFKEQKFDVQFFKDIAAYTTSEYINSN